MTPVEDFFKGVKGSERYAYIEEGKKNDYEISQPYNKLIEVLSYIEDLPEQSFFLKKGIVIEDQAGYVSTEIGTHIDGLTYAYFNISKEGGIPLAVLARIYEKPIDGYSSNFFKSSSDSSTNNMLKNNQIVVEGMLIEAHYVALCIDGIWYEYRDKGKGEGLISSSIDANADLVEIFN